MVSRVIQRPIFRLVAAACFLPLLAPRAGAELDLTPWTENYSFEGVPMERLLFANGPKRISYQPPEGWVVSGGGSSLTLRPDEHRSSLRAIIRIVDQPISRSFDPKSLEALRAALLQELSPDSAAKITGEGSNLEINGRKTWELRVEYSVDTRTYARSVLICNFEREQLQFEVRAPKAEFEEIHQAFIGSLYTWEGLE